MRAGGGPVSMEFRRVEVWFGAQGETWQHSRLTPVDVGTCDECGRVRVFQWHRYAEVRNRTRCPCGHKRNTVQKQQMLFIDRLEALTPTIPLEDVIFWHAGGHSAIGRMPGTDRWKGYKLGNFALGDETPTWVYLIAFPDWCGERFVKIGIGLDRRIQDHTDQGGVVLQKVKVPRWQARIIERLVLREHPRQRPKVPLPQFGDTECLVWAAADRIRLQALVTMTAGLKPSHQEAAPRRT